VAQRFASEVDEDEDEDDNEVDKDDEDEEMDACGRVRDVSKNGSESISSIESHALDADGRLASGSIAEDDDDETETDTSDWVRVSARAVGAIG
jgi:hypothetical protein